MQLTLLCFVCNNVWDSWLIFFSDITSYELITFKFMLKFYYIFNWKVVNSEHKFIHFNLTWKPIISSNDSFCVFVSRKLGNNFIFLPQVASLFVQHKASTPTVIVRNYSRQMSIKTPLVCLETTMEKMLEEFSWERLAGL